MARPFPCCRSAASGSRHLRWCLNACGAWSTRTAEPGRCPGAGGARRSPMSRGDVGCPEQPTYAANRGPMPVSPVTTSFDIARAPVPWHGRSPACRSAAPGSRHLRWCLNACGAWSTRTAEPGHCPMGWRRPTFSGVVRDVGCPEQPTYAANRGPMPVSPVTTSFDIARAPVPWHGRSPAVGRLLLAADISGGVLTPAAPGPRARPSPAVVQGPAAPGVLRCRAGMSAAFQQPTYAANRGPMRVSPVTTSFDIARAPVPWHGRSPAVGRLLLAADISGGVLTPATPGPRVRPSPAVVQGPAADVLRCRAGMSAALSSRPTRPTAARCRSLRSRPRLTSPVPRYHGTAVPLLVGRLLLAADISGGVLTPAAPGPRVRPSPAVVQGPAPDVLRCHAGMSAVDSSRAVVERRAGAASPCRPWARARR
ncbi:hypothetical protein KBTX_03799 [wastewater metagenome]|uniref:Uncharacterized protein n=2 Tax=unclassified sequences TaxID=12908 RepID=A0A5B8RHQ0_9ZZZZ|nr:hypothetical protein KBTEX_03799 [uncultured organism]